MNHFFMHAPKWRTGAGVLTLLVWLASCGPNNKTVEYPLIETANTNALDIAKVELTDSATILHTDAYYRPTIGFAFLRNRICKPGENGIC